MRKKEAVGEGEKWTEVVRFMIDLFDALAKSLEAWRELVARYNTTILEIVRDVRKLREVINEAPSEVKSALLDARLALEEVMSTLASGTERLLDEEEFNRIITTLNEVKDKLSQALGASTESGET